MNIVSLDLARRTGFAFGEAGEPPFFGSWLLRERDDRDIHHEPPALFRHLTRLTAGRRVDLIAVESPMDVYAQFKKLGHAAAGGIPSQYQLHGALDAWAGEHGVRTTRIGVNEARRVVCGFSTVPPPPGTKWTSAEQSTATKRKVRDTLVILGHLPKGTDDLDASDAVCIYAWAQAMHAGIRQGLVLA